MLQTPCLLCMQVMMQCMKKREELVLQWHNITWHHPTSLCPSAGAAAYLSNKSNTYLKDGCRTSNILKSSSEHPEDHLWGKWTWKKRVLKAWFGARFCCHSVKWRETSKQEEAGFDNDIMFINILLRKKTSCCHLYDLFSTDYNIVPVQTIYRTYAS